MSVISPAVSSFSGAPSPFFLVLAGNIGSGKTTLTQQLSRDLNLTAYFESVQNNPYLEDFYQDMSRWSFPLQIFFLNHRFQTHQQIERSMAGGIQDRSIYEDAHIFARSLFEQGDMSARDYENYLMLYQTMTSFLRPPALMVYLKRSVPLLRERIIMRNRAWEQQIPSDYLERLNFYYSQWYEEYHSGPKIMIDTDNLDFLHNKDDYQQLYLQVKSHQQFCLQQML